MPRSRGKGIIVGLAAPLLKESDPAAHVDIWRGVMAAMAIICVG